jgi:pyrimidine-specific ribonucleoside hydrolase
VIDTDPGIDDALALALAAMSPEVELRVVTTVTGNVPLAQTTSNALGLLAAFGREDVPVAPGAGRALVHVKPQHRAIHGENGLGGVQLPASRCPPTSEHAVQAMAALLRDAPEGSVTIVAIAPLTNIALLLALHPELTSRIGEVVVMGGSAGTGNVTPVAEYNTWADPEAAQRVFASGVKLRLAQLEVTRLAKVDAGTRRRLAAASPLGAKFDAMIDGYDDEPGILPALHDVVAVAAVIDPSLICTRPAAVEVVTERSPDRGQTAIDFQAGEPGVGVEVAVELDVERLRDLLIERISDGVH